LNFGNDRVYTKWYNTVITRNIGISMYMLSGERNKDELSKFKQILKSKYRKEYIRFLLTNPKFIGKLLLNR